jgi:U3 small nucleolar ribonucleoprotein protein IMP3
MFSRHTPPPCLSQELPAQVMRRYHIQDRDDYKKYNKLCGEVTHLVSLLKRLDARDSTRIELTDQLLDKCVAPRPCPS